jgi:hypothetical protein
LLGAAVLVRHGNEERFDSGDFHGVSHPGF